MKKFKVNLEEVFFGNFEVEAKNITEAKKLARKMLNDNDVPSGIMDESRGYILKKIKTIGIDRVDSKKTYHIKNCKSCCFLCNRMKRKITERKFINQCKKIANFKRAF